MTVKIAEDFRDSAICHNKKVIDGSEFWFAFILTWGVLMQSYAS